MKMNFPGEELVSTAIQTFSDGIIKKMDEAEARRERDFAFRLKELEYYKSNYDREIKDIFDYWFDVVRITHIKDNKNLTDQQRRNHEKRYNELVNIEKIARYKMNTMKYGGTETGRVFAIENKLHQSKYDDKPKLTVLYMWCAILAVLKKEVLGQDLNPTDIIQVLVNDYDDHVEEVNDAKNYITTIYRQAYHDNPYWI